MVGVNTPETVPCKDGGKLVPFTQADFLPADLKGLKACLRRDPLKNTPEDVTQWLRRGEMEMWVWTRGAARFGFLLQFNQPKELLIAYMWGRGGWAKMASGILVDMKILARSRGCTFLAASFRSWEMFKVARVKLGYVYGICEVEDVRR